MRRTKKVLSFIAPVLGAVLISACATGSSGGKPMGFFVTSSNSGVGANFGGLAGADKVCQALASDAGAGGRTWRAYLSASAMGGAAAVNARDRIGTGPWYNAKGELIASNVDELHGANKLTKATALSEKGGIVNGRGDTPNMHDILTGSSPDGRAMAGDKDTTCGNWTKGGDGSAIVGHSDRTGLDESAPAKSWNSSHPSQGCSLDSLKKTGGNGFLYCFASN